MSGKMAGPGSWRRLQETDVGWKNPKTGPTMATLSKVQEGCAGWRQQRASLGSWRDAEVRWTLVASSVRREETGNEARSGIRQGQALMVSRQVFRSPNSGHVNRQHRRI